MAQYWPCYGAADDGFLRNSHLWPCTGQMLKRNMVVRIYLLVRSVRVHACAAMSARIREALLHVFGARGALEALRTAALELAHRQRRAVAAVVARRRCAHVLLLAVFACNRKC